MLVSAAVGRTEMSALVIDLSQVYFMDSTGITALVRARNLCDDYGADLRPHGVQPRVYKVLEMTGLTDLFGLPEGDGGRC